MGILNTSINNIDNTALKTLPLNAFSVDKIRLYRGQLMLSLTQKNLYTTNLADDFEIIKNLGFNHLYIKHLVIDEHISPIDFSGITIHSYQILLECDLNCTGSLSNLNIQCGIFGIRKINYLSKCKNLNIRSNQFINYDEKSVFHPNYVLSIVNTRDLENCNIKTDKLTFYEYSWSSYKHNENESCKIIADRFLKFKDTFKTKFGSDTFFVVFSNGGACITNKQNIDQNIFKYVYTIDDEYTMYSYLFNKKPLMSNNIYHFINNF